MTAPAYADTEADYNKAAAKIPVAFERLEKALEKQGSGPFFNGAKYSLVDAAYAPFLQRYFFLDRVQAARPHREIPAPQGLGRGAAGAALDPFLPRGRVRGDVSANVKRRKKWVSQFVAEGRSRRNRAAFSRYPVLSAPIASA